MAKDIKVVFKGNKAPSGKNTNIEYMISSERLKKLEETKIFNIEILDKPKPKAKPKAKKKK
tara:strand:+ start:437 stop:619 length:183 start_codon:yes stop_codon:yes gene_type:complete